MKKLYSLLFAFAILLSGKSFSQMVLSDMFDFGEDRTSHSYAEFGSNIFIGAYTCQAGADSTIRVGNGTIGDSIHLTVAVNVNADSVILAFTQPWSGGSTPPLLFVDGVAQGSVPNSLCVFGNVILTNQQANTADGMLKIKIWDNASGFNMDGQIAFLNVYSNNFLVGISTEVKPKIKFTQTETEISFVNIAATSHFVLYDVLGKKVFEKTISETDNTINTALLPKGIYFFQIENGEQSLSAKILLK